MLQLPRLVAAKGGRIAVFDYGSSSIKVFSSSGALLWQFGRRGAGPGEFRGAFDLDFGPDGRLWALDPTLNRLTVLTNAGRLDTLFTPGTFWSAALVARAGGAIILTGRTDPFWIGVDSTGRTLGSGPLPITGLEEVPKFARQPMSAATTDGSRWVVVFPYGNVLLSYEHDRFLCAGHLVEGNGFPSAASPDLPFWVAGVAVADSVAAVLAQGETPERLRLLDLYSLDNCRYRRTLLLPQRVSALAYMDGTYVVEFEDPAPTLLGLRVPRNHD